MARGRNLGALVVALLASIRAASVPDFGAELSGLLNPLLNMGEQPAGNAGAPLLGSSMGPTTGSWLGGPSNGGADGQWLKEATKRSEKAQKEEEELIAAYQQQYMAAMQQQYEAALEAQEAHAQTGGGPWMGTPFVNGQIANTLDPAAPMLGVLELDQYTANKVIGGPTPVVVQFYVHSGLCPNCAVMSSVMRALGTQYATEQNIIIAKVNAMDAGQLSASFGVDQMVLPALLHYIEQHEDVIKEGQVPELRHMVTRFLISKDKSERDELRKQTSAQVNELRSEMVLYGESYVNVMERILTPSKTERWLNNQRTKLLAIRADASAPEAKQQKARRQLNVLADFEAALAEAKRVKDASETIRVAAEEAAAYAKRSKAKAVGNRENESVLERER